MECLAAGADADQRVVDAPDGAEQADEGRGGAHRGQDGQAGLQAGRELIDAVAQAACDPVAHVQRIVQVGLVLRWWARASRPSRAR